MITNGRVELVHLAQEERNISTPTKQLSIQLTHGELPLTEPISLTYMWTTLYLSGSYFVDHQQSGSDFSRAVAKAAYTRDRRHYCIAHLVG